MKTLYIFDTAHPAAPCAHAEEKLDWINFSSRSHTAQAVTNQFPGRELHELPFLQLFERESLRLKNALLQWVHQFGIQTLPNGKTVISQLTYQGVSLFWATLLHDQNPFKTEVPFAAMKLILLSELIRSEGYEKVILHTDQRSVAETVQSFCQHHGIRNDIHVSAEAVSFTKRLTRLVKRSLLAGTVYECLTAGMKRLRFRKHGASVSLKEMPDTVCVTYYPNINMAQSNEGRYLSNYWGQAQQYIDKEGALHVMLFVPAGQLTYAESASHTARYNNQQNGCRYTMLEQFITLPAIFRLFGTILLGGLRNKKLNNAALFQYGTDGLNLYHLHKDEWLCNTSGSLFAKYSILTEITNRLTNASAKAALFVYPCEMQPWELILNSAVREKRDGSTTFGVIHTTTRDLQLNYFCAPEEHRMKDGYPLPDAIGVNGAYAKHAFLSQEIPVARLLPVEAQRYTYLNTMKYPDRASQSKSILLIANTIQMDHTVQQLEVFAEACKDGVPFDEIWIKSHPFLDACAVADTIPGFPPYKKIDLSIGEALPLVTAVYAPNSTSVVIEGLIAGLPTLTISSLKHMNLTALREHPSLFIALDAEELKQHLIKAADRTTHYPPLSDYFYLDCSFSLWHDSIQLLKQSRS